jgi:hypothetical protein
MSTSYSLKNTFCPFTNDLWAVSRDQFDLINVDEIIAKEEAKNCSFS